MSTFASSNRLEAMEQGLRELSARLKCVEDHYQRTLEGAVGVPVSTFAPEPFEVIRDLHVEGKTGGKNRCQFIFCVN